MAIRGIIQLKQPFRDVDGGTYELLCGEFDGDDYNITAAGPYGTLVIPAENVLLQYDMGDEVDFPESPYVKRLN
jgi:hypothetical protein